MRTARHVVERDTLAPTEVVALVERARVVVQAMHRIRAFDTARNLGVVGRVGHAPLTLATEDRCPLASVVEADRDETGVASPAVQILPTLDVGIGWLRTRVRVGVRNSCEHEFTCSCVIASPEEHNEQGSDHQLVHVSTFVDDRPSAYLLRSRVRLSLLKMTFGGQDL